MDLTWKLKQLETSGQEANLKEGLGIKQVAKHLGFQVFTLIIFTMKMKAITS